MTQSKPPQGDPLDALFAEAKRATPDVPDALMSRVLADAVANVPKPDRIPIWKQLFATLGGWPAMAGLAATACVGIWTGGILSDDLMSGLGLIEATAVEFGDGLGTFDLLLVEG